MNLWYAFGTLGLTALLYFAAYQSNKFMKTVEIKGNLLLSIPEFIFKLLLVGLCLGLASSLDVSNPGPAHYFGWPSAQPAVDVVIGSALGLVIQFIVNFATTIAIRIFGPDIYSTVVMKNIVPQNARQWILIIPPLLLAVALEEILFRALLIGGFSTVVNPWVMAVASSVVFGLMHAPQGRLGVVATGLVGFVFAAIFIISNSLTMVICTHFIINFIQILRAKEDLAWFEKFRERRAAENLAALRAIRANAMQVTPITPEASQMVNAEAEPTQATIIASDQLEDNDASEEAEYSESKQSGQ